MADDDVWRDAIACQETSQGHVDGQHCRLGDRGVAELGFCGSEGLLVRRPAVWAVDKDIARQRPAQEGCHNLICFPKGLGDDGIEFVQLA